MQPSQKDRRKAKPAKAPGSWFTPMTVTHAIKDPCRKAQVPEWTAYQLRHLRAAELRTDFRIEAARAVLGHAAVGMTSHYARGADGKLATEVASKSG